MVRASLIWGANTGVGKTVVSAGLMRAAVQRRLAALYLKPVQTGVPEEAGDGASVARLSGVGHMVGRHAGALLQPNEGADSGNAASRAATLFAWRQPVSPHVAVATEGRAVDDEQLLRATRRTLGDFSSEGGEFALVETAGGVASPAPSGSLQCAALRPLGLPALLVGDGNLGGISATICASESLTARGHALDAVVLLRADATSTPAADPALPDLGNAEALRTHFNGDGGVGGPPVFELPHPFAEESLPDWYERSRSQLDGLLDLVLAKHAQRDAASGEDAESLLADDMRLLWHPYTSTTRPLPCLPVTRAAGVRLELSDGSQLIDGMSSWWAAVHGYAVPELDAAATSQLGRMSHVMFGGLTHGAAVGLGERLVECTPEPLRKVFLADSGSVAIEVAIKMALQYWKARGVSGRDRLLTVRGGYHGDTFGAMAVCDPINGMHAQIFGGVLPQHHFAPRPAPSFGAPCTDADVAEFRQLLENNRGEIAAVILEPIVQGAGGMRFYSAEYLKRVRAMCDEFGTLLILDCIATGFGRTGELFACEHAGISPDIMCVGKALTGGYMTLGATLATEDVADGASGGRDAASPIPLMHGPTFMGNPLACAVASASVDLLHASPWRERVDAISEQLAAELAPVASSPAVANVRTLGAIGVVEMAEPLHVPSTQNLLAAHGVWLRPFGKLLYTMPPFVMGSADLGRVTAGMRAGVEAAERGAQERDAGAHATVEVGSAGQVGAAGN